MSEQRESITRRFAVKKKSAYFLAIKITLDTYNLFRNRILEIFFEEILFRREKQNLLLDRFFRFSSFLPFFVFSTREILISARARFPFEKCSRFLRGGAGRVPRSRRCDQLCHIYRERNGPCPSIVAQK